MRNCTCGHTSTCDCASEDDIHVTDPAHGGKVTCHKCGSFITQAEDVGYWSFQHRDEFPNTHFHKACFNEYEHYYGLDKPID